MKDSKLSYLALTCSVGAVLLCGVSSMLSVFPNSSKIDALAHQVQTLTDENGKLRAMAEGGGENRARINELDVGLTALASVMKIDRNELAKAIAAAKGRQEADASAGQAPQRHVQSSGTPNAPAVTASQPQSGSTTTQPAPKADASSTTERVTPVAGIADAQSAGQQSDKPNPSPASSAHQDQQAVANAPLLGDDNPFAQPADTASAGGEVPATLAVAASKTAPVTIAQVDSVLGKRLSSNWYKPAGAADDLSTIIQLKMSRDGKVATVRLSKSSGNAAFDTSAISAVKSIGTIDEVRQLSDADFQKAYASRSIQFTPQMGG